MVAWRTALKRVISAIVLIPVVLIAILYIPAFWFTFAIFLLSFAAIREYNRMVLGETRLLPAGILSLAGAFLVFVIASPDSRFLPFYLFGLTVFYFFVSICSKREVEAGLKAVGMRLAGVLYVGLLLSHFVLLRTGTGENGPWWLLLACVIVWLNDTSAYYGGRAFGKNKLAPRISPGKTLEGAISGLVGGAVAAIIYVKLAPVELGFMETIGLAIVVGLFGIVGDLAESVIKRGAGAKDSGTIIPGHGGILDRIDSLLFAVPVVYYFVIYRGGIL